MRWAWLVLALAACGRLGFDDLGTDGGAGGGPGSGSGSGSGTSGTGPRLITSADMSIDSTATVPMPEFLTFTGDLQIVGVTTFSETSFVLGVSDDVGNRFDSASARATVLGGSTEIWYGAVSHSGATRLTVTLSEASGATVWLAEFAGLLYAPPTAAMTPDEPAAASVPGAEVMTPVPSSVVFSIVRLADGQVSRIHAGNSFTALGVLDAQAAAYLVANSPGAYHPEWDENTVASACASTAAFRPQ